MATYRLDDIAAFTIVTLRQNHWQSHRDSIKKFYDNIRYHIVINGIDYRDFLFDDLLHQPAPRHLDWATIYGSDTRYIIETKNIYPLNFLLNRVGNILFKYNDILLFAADDVEYIAPGFLEEGLELINNGATIVSLATSKDSGVAFMFTEQLIKDIGPFNEKLLGKECTDNDLENRVKNYYGDFPSIGRFWFPEPEHGWISKYIKHPHKSDINERLEELGIDSGSTTNKDKVTPFDDKKYWEKKNG